MFKLVQCAENTYYLKSFAQVGVYYLGENEVMLIDSGDHKKSVSDLDAALCGRGWRVAAIVNTHAHCDHITGNKFFYNKYGCKIYAPDTERYLIDRLKIDGTYFYGGLPVPKNEDLPSPDMPQTELLTKDILPSGFDIISLPGHTFNMQGIKTADGVWFTADALLSEETFEYYKLPFFLYANDSIKTAKMLKTLESGLFVPAHAAARESIAELAENNVAALESNKSLVLSLADGRTLEEIIFEADRRVGLKLTVDKFAKVSITVRGILQSLLDDGALDGGIEDGRMVYGKI